MLWSAVLQNTIAVFEEKVFNLCCHHCDEFSIDVSVFVDWLSLSNPNNNLKMRRAGLKYRNAPHTTQKQVGQSHFEMEARPADGGPHVVNLAAVWVDVSGAVWRALRHRPDTDHSSPRSAGKPQ